MKKSLLLGIALAVAVAGNAKDAVHVEASINSIDQTAYKAADRYSNKKMTSVKKEFSTIETKSSIRETKGSVPEPIAYYFRPTGSLYVGMSSGSYSLNNSFLKIPAFTEVSWKNVSFDATDFLWKYSNGYDQSDEVFEETDEENIITPVYSADAFTSPSLTASNFKGESNFQLSDYLLTLPYFYNSSIQEYFYQTNIRPDADVIGYLGATAFNDSGTATSLDKKYHFSEANYTNVQLKAVGELFRKPIKPYVLSSFTAHLCDLDLGAAPLKVKATIYPVTLDEDGNISELGEPLYEGIGDTDGFYASERQFQTVIWNDVTVKDENGRPADFIVDQDIFIQIEAADETSHFAQYLWASPSSFVYSDGYYLMEDGTSYVRASAVNPDGETEEFILDYVGLYDMAEEGAAESILGALHSFPIQILAESYYLYTPDTEFIAATDTQSSKTFEIESWYGFEAWSVYAEDQNGEEVDWIEFSAEDEMSGESFTGIVKATFTVDALPEGITGREANIEISYYGATLNIHVQQGESGVKGVEVKSAQYVNVVGNDFVVKATSDVTKAEVYTAAGVKVAEAAVNGTATINAAGLAHGVYFVKLNNGKTVKVVK